MNKEKVHKNELILARQEAGYKLNSLLAALILFYDKKLDRHFIFTNFIQTDMLDFSLIYCKFQSSMKGSQGTVDLTLEKNENRVTG